jgi:hypothetical protein
MGRQLLQHLLVTDPLSESHDNRCIRNMWNSPTYLGEAGDEGLEGFPGLLPHNMEVGLHTVLLVRAGEVRRKQRAELPQDWIDPGVRFMSHVRAGPVKATRK